MCALLTSSDLNIFSIVIHKTSCAAGKFGALSSFRLIETKGLGSGLSILIMSYGMLMKLIYYYRRARYVNYW